MKTMPAARLVLPRFVILSLCFGGCAASSATVSKSPAPARSLFDRLGGRPAISAVVDRFVAKTGSDPRIEARFLNADKPHLKAAMVDHISEISGGPYKYSGKDMRAAHAGMKLTEEEFAAFMDDLKAVLDEFKVGPAEQKDVLAAFNGLKADTINQ